MSRVNHIHSTHNKNYRHPRSQTYTNSDNARSVSRKRRFHTCNQDTNTHHYNSQPPSKRMRYNNNRTVPQFRQQKYRNNHNRNYSNPNRNYPKVNAHKPKEMEQDFHRITQRMRQVDIGKATQGYKNYIALVPKDKRVSGHPRSPNPRYKMPNKHWKKAVNQWRKALHTFDAKSPAHSPQKNKENIDTNLEKFCCEKCRQTFGEFDEWQKHRKECDGIQLKTECKKERTEVKECKHNIEHSLDSEKDKNEDIQRVVCKDFENESEIAANIEEQKEEKVSDEEEDLLMDLQDILGSEDDFDLF